MLLLVRITISNFPIQSPEPLAPVSLWNVPGGTVRARPAQVHRVVALSSAVHSVVEQVEVMLPDGLHQAVVMATNVYHKTPEGWRLVAHHASPGVAPDAQVDVLAQRPVLH